MIQKLFENDALIVETNISLIHAVSKMDGYVATDVRHLVDKAVHIAASEAGKKNTTIYLFGFNRS